MRTFQLFICFSLFIHFGFAQTSSLVSINSSGELSYKPDGRGNIIPDFSGVGYKNSEKEIPEAPVVITLSPKSGDNHAQIQAAINSVASMPFANGVDGVRGAILLKAGTYEVSKTLQIKESGVVLRGEGPKTILQATGTVQHDFIEISGSKGKSNNTSSKREVIDQYLAIGTKTLTVESNHDFQKGDWVHLIREPNEHWIQSLGMDKLNQIDPNSTNWTPASFAISFERQILNVQGNVLTIDAPVVDPVDPSYAKAYVVKFTSSRINHCGVENMKLVSSYTTPWDSSNKTAAHDEEHGWNAIIFKNAEHSWVKNVDAYHFGYSCVHVEKEAAFITVDGCGMYEAISKVEGSRRYSFTISGQRSLIKNCITEYGRHDFVNGARVAGPNVFQNCYALNQLSDMGPHHRWSTGILYDNIIGDGKLNVQDRQNSGTGHGWAGGQIMLWNCDVKEIVIQNPQLDHRNWAIGCRANKITGVGSWGTREIGVVESKDKPITSIPSLFDAQLNERLEKLTSLALVKGDMTGTLKLHVYPNPTVGTLYINHNLTDNSILSIVDAQGREVKRENNIKLIDKGNTAHKIDVSDLQDGLYFISLSSPSDGKTASGKFTIKK